MALSPALYVGSGKEIARDGLEPFLAIELDLDELKSKMQPDHVRKWTDAKGNERRVLKLILAPLRPESVTPHRTHSLKIDTWKPDRPAEKPPERPRHATNEHRDGHGAEPEPIDDSVPF